MERLSNSPLAGVLVELRNNMDSLAVANVLTTAEGLFSVRAPSPGRYFVEAKRIGVSRYRSGPLELTTGATIAHTISLDPLSQLLPVVQVLSANSCTDKPEEATQLAALWDEARTALTATNVSLRDQLFRARVRRFVRELDPKSLKVRSETQSAVSATVTVPFAEVHPETLSVRGYWHRRGDGRIAFFGPDPTLLLSDAFTRDHCLYVVPSTRRTREWVGLGFAPVAARDVPDVAGVMWLDAKTFRLASIDFSYTVVPPATDSAALGGALHFAQLANGAWLVRSWSLRLPVEGSPGAPLSTNAANVPWVLVRPLSGRLQEVGGEVTGEIVRPTPR